MMLTAGEYLTDPFLSLAPSSVKRERHQEIFEKRQEEAGRDDVSGSKFVGTALVFHEVGELTVRTHETQSN